MASATRWLDVSPSGSGAALLGCIAQHHLWGFMAAAAVMIAVSARAALAHKAQIKTS
ncbi:hypothetical protein [Rhodococcus sp. JVH1]|uniref:hypothetical protein n=1 Tax=Rhodococcus sp. JVH1 TaxID=745408 RepID=UPI000271F346|nr:hypothetical protein JVH1_0104 [Rhodococcus sp. JVH1]